jgi:hypothetical protein
VRRLVAAFAPAKSLYRKSGDESPHSKLTGPEDVSAELDFALGHTDVEQALVAIA